MKYAFIRSDLVAEFPLAVVCRVLPVTQAGYHAWLKRPASAMSVARDALAELVNPAQCGGRPCIRAMRIRVADILERLASGVSDGEILADFPDLERDDIRASLHYAAQRSDIVRLAAKPSSA